MTKLIHWKRCGDDGHWCNLKNLILDNISDVGVYIIWHTGDKPHVVRVGQGNIAERLREHRCNPKIAGYGDLLVTWAVVATQSERDAIERHLADVWNPLVGDAFPNVKPLAVNSPFE